MNPVDHRQVSDRTSLVLNIYADSFQTSQLNTQKVDLGIEDVILSTARRLTEDLLRETFWREFRPSDLEP